jgi:DNA (cytosine-5)-methyltransferase 1
VETIIIVDLFAGCGGASEGVIAAAEQLGLKVEIYAVNCWPEAIAVYKKNHPYATTLCQRVEQVVPEQLIPGRRINFLVAGPECTHHSVARGGMPVDDQRRVPAWVVPNWLQRMVVDYVLIENVPEFQSWAPLGANGKPLKSKKGKIFRSYLDSIRSCGYNVDHRVLCCADYGDATTRKRLFIQAWRKGTPRWPVQTHTSREKLKSPQSLFITTPLKPWRGAREIIDWNLKGTNIFDRKKPLAPKTMKRIAAGMKKINGLDIEPFLVKLYGTGTTAPVGEPLPTVTAKGNHLALAEPFILSQASGGALRPVSEPAPTICAKGAEQLVEPFIVDQFSSHKAKTTKAPLGTITTTSRGVRLLEPFVVSDPFLVAAGGPMGKARQPHDLSEPLHTVLTENHEALVEPFLMVVNHGDKGSASAAARAKSIEEPMPTATAANTFGVVDPYITKFYGTGTFANVDDPLDTVTTRDRFGLVQPKLLKIGEGLYLGIRFRMLQDYELAGAHGFPKSFQFTKKKSVNVKLVGNSWPRETATSLCLQALRNYVEEPVLMPPPAAYPGMELQV